MPRLFFPPVKDLQAFLASQSPLDFSYPGVGNTLNGTAPAGFDHDFNQVTLGSGDDAWSAARDAIRAWKMFPGIWAGIWPAAVPVSTGQTVAMMARVMGLWWLNSCRIVYVIAEKNRFGFAYGTLPGHVECGEELFLVERDDAGTVRYSIRAFSRPRHWLARLGYPLARMYQRKFVRDSKASMARFVLDRTRSQTS